MKYQSKRIKNKERKELDESKLGSISRQVYWISNVVISFSRITPKPSIHIYLYLYIHI